MMNKRIRSMIDEIFSEMKMTAENLALRDELMANAQARYEDVIAQGKSEEEAFAQVAASLGDVNDLLHEMNAQPQAAGSETGEAAQEAQKETENPQEAPAKEEPEQPAADESEAKTDIDLGDMLNKAFSAMSDFGRSIMPQAKKLVQQVDDATGGAIKSVGKAVNKGVKDAQRAAGDAIDRMSDSAGEIILDFGRREEAKRPSAKTPDMLRREAEDLRAQANLKQVVGDAEGAQQLRVEADVLCNQADAMEQEAAMQDAMRAAQEAAEAPAADEDVSQTPVEDKPAEEAPALETKNESVLDEDGDVNEDAFSKVVEQIQRDTERMIEGAGAFVEDALGGMGGEPAQEADYTVRDAQQPASGKRLFPAAGLHAIDIELDADDVCVEIIEGDMIETEWTAKNVDGEPEIGMDGHKLKIRRKNPDVFKTFFSVFSKNGGEITVRVPRGYAAEYKISTTSGDIRLSGVDVDSVKANSTSGGIRLEPDAGVRADLIKASTVSGAVTVSACAIDIKADTVSGAQFISCDAEKVEADTVSGKVHIEGACETWDVDSVSGAVELICTVAPTKKIDIDTTSATACVALPGDIRGFAAKLSGMSGRIVNEFGPDRYGTCALPIQMDSISGSLMITRL